VRKITRCLYQYIDIKYSKILLREHWTEEGSRSSVKVFGRDRSGPSAITLRGPGSPGSKAFTLRVPGEG